MTVPDALWHRCGVFHGFRLDDPGTLAEIRRLHATALPIRTPRRIAAARRTRRRAAPTVAGHRPSGEVPDAMSRHRSGGVAAQTGGADGATGTLCGIAERSGRVEANVRALVDAMTGSTGHGSPEYRDRECFAFRNDRWVPGFARGHRALAAPSRRRRRRSSPRVANNTAPVVRRVSVSKTIRRRRAVSPTCCGVTDDRRRRQPPLRPQGRRGRCMQAHRPNTGSASRRRIPSPDRPAWMSKR
jgi:hypothetical protein